VRELGELADRAESFARLGTRVYAISTREPEDLKGLQEDLGSGVTLLSDPGAVAVSAFGMLDPRFGFARAGTFLLDRQGRVKYVWLTENYRRRPDPDEVLEKARG